MTNQPLGTLDLSEVRWALDMLNRGDVKGAKELLQRVLREAPRDFPRDHVVSRY